MKRIRVHAMILALLACAVIANAQQKLVLPGLSGAQVSAVASGNKVVQLPPTDSNGTLDLSVLGLGNITNKTITLVLYQCDKNKPPLIVVLLPGQTPPDKPDCQHWILGGFLLDSSGAWTQVAPGDPNAPYSVQITGTPAAVPQPKVKIGEGPSPFNVQAYFNGGFWRALDLTDTCSNVTAGTTCNANNRAFAFGGGAILYFVPFAGLDLGFVKTNNASVTTSGGGSGGPTGGTSFTDMQSVKFSGLQVGARINALAVGEGKRTFRFGVQGGDWVGTARETDSFTSSFSGTSQTSVFRDTSGFSSPYWGAYFEFPLCNHMAATFDYKHAILRSGSSHMETDLWLWGLAFYIHDQKSLIKVGSGKPSPGW